MDVTFSPSQRRLYWYDMSYEDIIDQWISLSSSQRPPRRTAPYVRKIECVNDIVMAEMEEWLVSASSETLRHCARLRNAGEITPYIREQLIHGLRTRCDASQRVEYLMGENGGDRAGLIRRLESWGVLHSPDETLLELVNKLVQREHRERDFKSQSTERGTAGGQRPQLASLRPPRRLTETGSPSEQTPAPNSEPLPTVTIPTPSVTPPSAPPPESSRTCIVCRDKEANSVFYPCGHQYSCFDCAEEWARLRGGRNWRLSRFGVYCPACRQSVQDIIRTYAI